MLMEYDIFVIVRTWSGIQFHSCFIQNLSDIIAVSALLLILVIVVMVILLVGILLAWLVDTRSVASGNDRWLISADWVECV